MRLFSYKMTHDTGFAPNPFGHMLTLATCKPQMRRAKQVGDWIAGFTSKALSGDGVGEERLIYLMRVGKKLALGDYYIDPLFQDKIPNPAKRGPIAKAGDNIYRPLVPDAIEPAHFQQLPNPNHWNIGQDSPDVFHLERDVLGRYALVADEFYYFGCHAIALPEEVRPALPRGQSAHGKQSSAELADRFVGFIRASFTPGRHGTPTQWPDEKQAATVSCAARR